MLTNFVIIVSIVALYIVVTSGIAAWCRKSNTTDMMFMTGGRKLGPVVVGVSLMSQWAAAGAIMGTAETAFGYGISASWNITTMVFAQILFGLVLAKKYQQSGEYTVSGVIEKKYGTPARAITSLVMVYALCILNVSFFVGGGATLSAILKVPYPLAIIIIAIVTGFYVAMGGFKGVIYTNLVHAFFKYLGVGLCVFVAWKMSGGMPHLQAVMRPTYFSWTGLGMPTIIAWTVANVGTVFCTQTVVQAMGSMPDSKSAKQACWVAGLLLLPMGFAATYVGVVAKAVFPAIKGSWAFPQFAASTNPWVGGIIVAALLGAVFGSTSANALGAAALLMRDIYTPWVKPGEKHKLIASRTMSALIGLLPIPFALVAPGMLKTIFFARGLRTSIAIVALSVFYAPFFCTSQGAVAGLAGSIVGTTIWYLLGNPFGINSIYISVIIPLIAMTADHFLKPRVRGRNDPPPAKLSEKTAGEAVEVVQGHR
jgi:SSS family solute:Na+ symporter